MDLVKVPKKRILLTEEDFTTLVSGNILVKDNVEIALQDIGYRQMVRIIEGQDRGNIPMSQREIGTLQQSIRNPLDNRLNNNTYIYDNVWE